MIHAPASSPYSSLAAVEAFVLSMGASYFSRSVLSTTLVTVHAYYPSVIFPDFLHMMFDI